MQYIQANEFEHGGVFKYKLTLSGSEQCIKNISAKDILENIHDKERKRHAESSGQTGRDMLWSYR